jgi:hypothetical protein
LASGLAFFEPKAAKLFYLSLSLSLSLSPGLGGGAGVTTPMTQNKKKFLRRFFKKRLLT